MAESLAELVLQAPGCPSPNPNQNPSLNPKTLHLTLPCIVLLQASCCCLELMESNNEFRPPGVEDCVLTLHMGIGAFFF